MPFYIVSGSNFFLNLLETFCTTEGFDVLGKVRSLAEIPESCGPCGVLLHIRADTSIAELGIHPFVESHSDARIVVLASRHSKKETIGELAALVNAIVSDEMTPKSLSGLLAAVDPDIDGFSANRQDIDGHPPHEAQIVDDRIWHRDRAIKIKGNGVSGSLDGAETIALNSQSAQPAQKVSLSAREIEVLRMLGNGRSNKEIAKRLSIMENTVKVHLRACYLKINVNNRTQAAVWASRHLPQ